MDKKIVQAVQKRSGGVCEVCKGNYLLQHHHVIGGKGKRKLCENKYSVKFLCWNCHHGDYGVHGKNGDELDLKLKKELQNTLYTVLDKNLYTEEELIEILGIEPRQSWLLVKKLPAHITGDSVYYRKENIIKRLMGDKFY